MSSALPGSHFCINHQGNHSHYAKENCEVCTLQKEISALRKKIADALSDEGVERAISAENKLAQDLLDSDSLCHSRESLRYAKMRAAIRAALGEEVTG